MKFFYASYEVEPSATFPEGIVYRPEATIRVGGPRGNETIQALLDTGSDETVFPATLAKVLGVDLDYDATSQASAVGGHEVRLVPGTVTLELSHGGEKYRWSSLASFLETEEPEDEVALLGYAGFLEYFQATFDSERNEVALIPNARFASI